MLAASPITTEALHLAAIDERTDRTRRSLGPSIGNGLLLLAFIVLPGLPGASAVFGDLELREGLMLSLPALLCVVVGAVLYRRLGPRHRLYRALDAVELGAFHSFPAFFPVIDGGTAYIAGGFLIVSAAFWGQGKPGRARVYGVVVGLLGLAPAVVLWSQGHTDRATLAASFGMASLLAFVMCVRVRLESVRAEMRRDQLREEARVFRVATERAQIQRELSGHVFSQLEALATQLELEGLPEAATARRLSETVSEFVVPTAQPIEMLELSKLAFARCRALCPGVALKLRGPTPSTQHVPVTAASARAVLRIAQELVRNSVMHGAARTIEVVLELEDGMVRLRVSDDGVGLSEPVALTASGGLRNARAWAAESGGELALERQPGFSTSLTVTLQPASV